MGRCRPRGSSMQRSIGRAVGRGLRDARNYNSYSYSTDFKLSESDNVNAILYAIFLLIFFGIIIMLAI